jgi:hypothetical protein
MRLLCSPRGLLICLFFIPANLIILIDWLYKYHLFMWFNISFSYFVRKKCTFFFLLQLVLLMSKRIDQQGHVTEQLT